MNRDQAVFLITGVLFGIVIGYLIAQQVHSTPAAAPATAATAPPGAAAGQPGVDAQARMEQLTQRMDAMRAQLDQNPHDVEALVGLGNLYYDAGMFSRAIEFYTHSLEIDPDNPNVITDLGISHRRTGDPQKALEMFRQATEIRPEHWQSWLNIGIVTMFDLGDHAQAEEALDRVEELKPDLPNLQSLREHLQLMRENTASTPG
ncbi:MAG: tetratricopeptide repeat protein [Acidobacteriota bacterium]